MLPCLSPVSVELNFCAEYPWFHFRTAHFGLRLLKTKHLLRNLNLQRMRRMTSVQMKRTLCRFPPADPNTSEHKNRRGNDPTERFSREPAVLTFCLVVGELVVGEAEPPLLEVLHSKPVSSLSSFYHKSEGKKTQTPSSDVSLTPAWMGDLTAFYLIWTICQRLFLHLHAGIIIRLEGKRKELDQQIKSTFDPVFIIIF